MVIHEQSSTDRDYFMDDDINYHFHKRWEKETVDPNSVVSLDPVDKNLINTPDKFFKYLCKYYVSDDFTNIYYGKLLKSLGFHVDKHGNWFKKVGESDTAFMAHLDTASWGFGRTRYGTYKDFIYSTNSNGIGADDRAGVCVLLFMYVNNIPGQYCLFNGEEMGCFGSKEAAKYPMFNKINKAISFDRRGECSIITHQIGTRTCSNEFAISLARQFNTLGLKLFPDPTGLYTDSNSFRGKISECTNISVGYGNEHTDDEYQDLEFLRDLCKATLKIKWNNLPINRKPFIDNSFYTGVLSGSRTVSL